MFGTVINPGLELIRIEISNIKLVTMRIEILFLMVFSYREKIRHKIPINYKWKQSRVINKCQIHVETIVKATNKKRFVTGISDNTECVIALYKHIKLNKSTECYCVSNVLSTNYLHVLVLKDLVILKFYNCKMEKKLPGCG